VLPLGYSFNLDGSMMYCTFAVLFIAQAYKIDLSASQQITMLLLLMVTSKGMAGVPRASLVVIAATLATFNLPEAGLLLILLVLNSRQVFGQFGLSFVTGTDWDPVARIYQTGCQTTCFRLR
jgi:Na+/H+-dicarboxylate symporter